MTTEATATATNFNWDALKHEYLSAIRQLTKIERAKERAYAPYAKQIEAINAEFETKHALLLGESIEAQAARFQTEEALRNAIVGHYELTKEKTIDENLGVQVRRSFKYEMADAVKWAETNAPVMIEKSVDKKKFEKFAADLDFVEIEEKVSSVLKGLTVEESE